MRGKDDQLHSIETDAESVFEAAYEGLHDWARLWWYSPDSIIEVRSGGDCWRVRPRRAAEWYAQQRDEGSAAAQRFTSRGLR